MINQKSNLRAEFRRYRQERQADVAAAYQAAVGQVVQSPAWLGAGTVALYLPLPDEPDLMPLVEDAWSRGVQVVLPRVVAPKQALEFAAYSSDSPLVAGRFGTRHPAGPAIDPGRIDWVAVPGLAADFYGYRLGYGGGYYDRTLPALTGARRVWIGARDLVLVRLPIEPWDVPAHLLATEEGIFPVAEGPFLEYPGSTTL